MKGIFSKGYAKVQREGLGSLLQDCLVYAPQGLSKKVTTPEGVELELEGLSPVTVGRIRSGGAEQAERRLIPQIPDKIDVIELGAGTGYLTTLINRTTDGRHLAIEPNPEVFPILKRTLELNDSDFKPIHAAYHPTKDQVHFPATRYFKTGSIRGTTGETAVVDATDFESVLTNNQLDDPLLHVDIEGSEKLLLEHELDSIQRYCAGVFIEFHPEALSEIDKYVDELTGQFELVAEEGDVKLFLRPKYIDTYHEKSGK